MYVRNAHSRAYDENRNKVVLFGGAGISKVFGDTWEWTNYDWNRVAPVVRCQGHDTWEYDGFAWRKISISDPIARNHCAMGYNIKNKRTVLFGGHDGENVFGDTWAFADKTWTLLRKMEFMARIKNNH